MKAYIRSIKNICILLLLIFINIKSTVAQNVGIFTLNPNAPFHLFNSGQTITNGGFMLLGNRNELHLGVDFNRFQSGYGIDNVPTTFYVQPEGGNSKIEEKVAIGTNSFSTGLNVNAGTPISETNKGKMVVGNADGLHLRFDGNEVLARNGNNPSTLYLQQWGGNISMVQNNDGKVGIGTSLPQAKVHITDATDLNLSDGGHLILGQTTGYNLAFDNNEIMARNNGGVAQMYLQGNGGDILMIPNESGQVGIGVISSASIPDGYMLAVDGKILAEEIRVDLSGDWPDYVFENDYILMPLRKLSEEIQRNKHLPGIPSAADIEANGLELGDMQKRMMEKIEELTLYLINADKQLKSLDQDLILIEEN